MLGFLAAGAAKFASAGAVAQAATGLGIALASVTGAGAAGVLPAGVQDHVSGVLEAVTPFDLPGSDEPSSTPAVEETGGTQEETATDNGATNDLGQLPPDGETVPVTPEQAGFGADVSTDAQDGGVDGRVVSGEARAEHRPDRPDTPASEGSVPVPAAPERPDTPASEGSVAAPVAPDRPDTERPESAPAPADQAADHIPTQPGRP
jgi:hypothetical protein